MCGPPNPLPSPVSSKWSRRFGSLTEWSRASYPPLTPALLSGCPSCRHDLPLAAYLQVVFDDALALLACPFTQGGHR